MLKLRVLNLEMASIHAAAFLLGAAGLASRLFGVIRDRLLAAHFGAGRELDIYYAAFQIPDLISAIFLLGAGSAAILPVFQEYLVHDRTRARRLISLLAEYFLLGALICALAAFVLAPWLVRLAVPGFSAADQEHTAALMRIMILSPVFLGLSSIFSAVGQSFQRFVAYAISPILYNIGIIAGILFFAPSMGIAGLALGVSLGALLHALIQLVSVSMLGFAPQWVSLRMPDAGMKKIFTLSFPRVLSLSLLQLTSVALVGLGSLLAAGSITIFQFAQNLYFVPVGIFGVSYSVTLFPRMTMAFLERDGPRFFRDFFLGVRSILLWIIPSMVLFWVLRAHIVRVVLGARAFSWEDTRLTAACLGILIIAMLAGSLIPHVMKGFYALERTWAPLVIDVACMIWSVVLSFVFSHALARPTMFRALLAVALRVEDIGNIAVLGIALGFSLGLLCNVLLLYAALMRSGAALFGSRPAFPFLALGKIVLAALAAGIAAYIVRMSFSDILPLITASRVFFQGAGAGVVGMLTYFAVLVVLGSEDIEDIRASVTRHLFGLNVLPKSWNGDPPRV